MSKQVFLIQAMDSEVQNTYQIKREIDLMLKSTAKTYSGSKQVIVLVEIMEL